MSDRRVHCRTCRVHLPVPREGVYPWDTCHACWVDTPEGKTRTDIKHRLLHGQVWKGGTTNAWMKVDPRSGMLIGVEDDVVGVPEEE